MRYYHRGIGTWVREQDYPRDTVLPPVRVALEPGEMAPEGYGMAYTLYEYHLAVYCPVPLNLLLAGWRRLMRALRWSTPRTLELDQWRMYREVYERARAEVERYYRVDEEMAYARGFDAGKKAAMQVFSEEIERLLRREPPKPFVIHLPPK